MTALHYAALSGSESTVKILVKQKSELTLTTNVSLKSPLGLFQTSNFLCVEPNVNQQKPLF